MARSHSYQITINNNVSEKEAISFLIESNKNFICPDRKSRKLIMSLLNLDKKFSRSFDLILLPTRTNLNQIIKFRNLDDIVLIELKTTKKKLENNPRGFFFGATQNEFDLAEKLEDKFKFCFVSLHPESKGFKLMSLTELNNLIQTKRIQYQINLKK